MDVKTVNQQVKSINNQIDLLNSKKEQKENLGKNVGKVKNILDVDPLLDLRNNVDSLKKQMDNNQAKYDKQVKLQKLLKIAHQKELQSPEQREKDIEAKQIAFNEAIANYDTKQTTDNRIKYNAAEVDLREAKRTYEDFLRDIREIDPNCNPSLKELSPAACDLKLKVEQETYNKVLHDLEKSKKAYQEAFEELTEAEEELKEQLSGQKTVEEQREILDQEIEQLRIQIAEHWKPLEAQYDPFVKRTEELSSELKKIESCIKEKQDILEIESQWLTDLIQLFKKIDCQYSIDIPKYNKNASLNNNLTLNANDKITYEQLVEEFEQQYQSYLDHKKEKEEGENETKIFKAQRNTKLAIETYNKYENVDTMNNALKNNNDFSDESALNSYLADLAPDIEFLMNQINYCQAIVNKVINAHFREKENELRKRKETQEKLKNLKKKINKKLGLGSSDETVFDEKNKNRDK